MREIHCNSIRRGRSGHVLKDLFTTLIMQRLLGARAVRSRYWQEQKLISSANVNCLLPAPRVNILKVAFYQPRNFWQGINWNEFEKFKMHFSRLPDPCRVTISSVYRIHLHQVKNWEDNGKIEGGSYASLLADLRRLYWGRETIPEPSQKVRKIVLHARRGDVAAPGGLCFNTMGPGKWSAQFYQEKIDCLRKKYPTASIRLLTEKQRSSDLDNIFGAEIDKGDITNLSDHFREMVEADLFLPSNSSLSTWAAYLTQGLVAISQSHPIKHFRFNKPPSNHFEL